MAAATGRIKRLKQIDRVAVGVITLGGLAVVVSVIGILVFIAAEAIPLFRPAAATLTRSVTLAGTAAGTTTAMAGVGVDETRRYFYSAQPNGVVAFFALDSGARVQERPLASIAGAQVTASSRSLANDFVALGTNDGRVALAQIKFAPVYEGSVARDVTIDLAERGLVVIDQAKRPVRRVAYLEEGEQKFVAAQTSDSDVALWWTDSGGTTHQQVVPAGGGLVTAIGVGRTGTAFAGNDRGEIHVWELGDTAERVDTVSVGTAAITSLGYVIGERTLIAGTADGKVSAWFRAPTGAEDTLKLVRAAEFEPQGAAITGMVASTRDRTFATASADGEVVLRHQTSGRTLLRLSGTAPVHHVVLAPRSDGLFVERANAAIDQFALANPHPEVSWTTLFGKVWYEGYPQPEYVWQSTGATDDFEPKISLVPLIFGTIKGTFYALIFAIPLAVFGALYTSQFVHPTIRARIKPTVEIMAALPSVVIGFVAGLYLAPVVERNLVGVMLLLVFLPIFGTSGFLLWRWLPAAFQRRLKVGAELLVIIPLLLLGAWVALALAPAVGGRAVRRRRPAVAVDDARHHLRSAQQPRRRSGDGLCRHSDHLHDLRGRVFERALDAGRRLPRTRREPLADGRPRHHSNREPWRVLRDHGRLWPRRGRDHDRADGDRKHAGARLVHLQRLPDAVRQHRGGDS